MVEQTIRLKAKGYTIEQFLSVVGFKLRWYRYSIKPDAPSHDLLNRLIDELENKNGN